MTVSYRVDAGDPAAHRYCVTLTVAHPAAAQMLSLPVWIPGSYLVREFARHVVGLSATQGGQPVDVRPVDKSTWVADCSGARALVVRYEVHAFDTSVRAAFLDAERGFFNGTSLCLRVHGREDEPHTLRIGTLPRGWQVATAMTEGPGRRTWVAADYDELVDHPFELGRFWRTAFRVAGVDFELVVTGAWPTFDGERLAADVRRLCAVQIGFWHGRGQAPFDRYVFLLHAADDGYGGLEHRSSTALLAARRDLPRRGESDRGDGYAALLGLISHEFFHAWNIKRLRPREFMSLDYTRENTTHLLWFFEGVTSYYDDLFVLRAGLIDVPRYLKSLAKAVNALAATPGRHAHSLAQSSFDAWIKYYRADENTPNATVSYYGKGALAALAFDLTLRAAGRGSLDDVMCLLWQRCAGTGVGEADIAQALADVAGRPMDAEMAAWIHGTAELPLQPLLAAAGVDWASEPATGAAALGLRLSEGVVSGVQVRHVLRGSAAEAAGLSPGDELLAVDGWRIRRFDDARQWLVPGRAFEVLLTRDQRVRQLQVQPGVAAAPTVTLALAPGARSGPDVCDAARAGSTAAMALRRDWLGS